MAVKTAIRRAFPYLPVSIVAQEAAAADEQTPDYSSVLSPVVPTVEQEPADEPVDVPEGIDPETGEIMAEIVSTTTPMGGQRPHSATTGMRKTRKRWQSPIGKGSRSTCLP